MFKETKALADSGMFREIHLVGMAGDSLAAEEVLDSHRRIVRLGQPRTKRGTLAKCMSFAAFVSRILGKYATADVSIISCHCLALLPVCVILKLMTGARLVYEAHELETERHGWGVPLRRLAKLVEWVCIKLVDWTIVVGPSIDNWYRKKYGLDKISVVRNIPASRRTTGKTDLVRKRFSVPDDSLVFIYQGVLNSGRGIQIALNVFAKLRRHHIVFLGFGPLENTVKEACSRHPNMHYLGALPPGQSEPYTAGADVGLAIFENTSLSYFYSCPNKLFEYILAGIPVIASDFPDMAAIVDELQCGWKTAVDESSIYNLIESLSMEAVSSAASAALENGSSLSWESEATILVNSYRSVLAKHANCSSEVGGACLSSQNTPRSLPDQTT
jgi:glycosyltransferase involved in cell wall biosynthesis